MVSTTKLAAKITTTLTIALLVRHNSAYT